MTNFNINNIEYTTNTSETAKAYYYKVVDGKKKRISEAEYMEAFEAWVAEQNDVAEAEDLENALNEAVEMEERLAALRGYSSGMTRETLSTFSIEELTEMTADLKKKVEKAEEAANSDKEAEDTLNKKKAKKAKRSKKNVAFTLSENGEVIVTITEKQRDFFNHMKDTNFWEHGLESCPWIDILADEIGGQFAGKPMTVGAMISTLREKGLIEVARDMDRKGHPKFFTLTDLGKRVAVAIEAGLE